MVLKRKQQILEGEDYHYILINIFDIIGASNIEDSYPLEILKSDYYKIDAKMDFKHSLTNEQENDYLPFPFVVDRLEMSDFIKLKQKTNKNLIKQIEGLYQTEIGPYEENDKFDNEFRASIDVLKNTMESWNGKSDYYILTIGKYENDNNKIHLLYHDMNFIHDYFYFVIGLNEQLKETIIIELGYE